MKYKNKLYEVERIETITNGDKTRDVIAIKEVWSGAVLIVHTEDIPKLLEDINIAMSK